MNSSYNKYAYVTALTTEEYIPGCLALARSLIEVNSRYKLIVLIPESKQDELKEKLDAYGFFKAVGHSVIISVQPDIEAPNDEAYAGVDTKYSFWKYSFFKLQSARLFEYEKVILLDCDQMALKNIDHLFDKPHLTATTCGRCIHPDWLSLSAGLLVIEPTEQFYNELIAAIELASQKKYKKGLNAGDQDVFNEVAPFWKDRKDLYIPEKYNICWGMIEALCKKENISVDELYMVHFPGKEKPWHRPRYYYLKIFIVYLLTGKIDKLLYKVRIYGKYRRLCCPKK